MKLYFLYAQLVFFIFTGLCLKGQKVTDNWYYGNHAALNFSTTPPSLIVGSAMNAAGGTASISDQNGSLLFYTDGDTIFNAMHQVMPNGAGLLSVSTGTGPLYSVSPVLIVKKPLSNNIYYVFTQSGPVTSTQVKGLRYTTVDMSLSSGTGSVIAKNDTLYVGEQTQKLAGTYHCNGTDIWVMTVDHPVNLFRAYLITAAGINTIAVTSPSGFNTNMATSGQMKFSPNGRKLGMAASYNFHLFDFDNSTGIVSNFTNLGPGWYASGCEFSPDGTKFYGSSPAPQTSGPFSQWNLAAGSTPMIIASRFTYTVQNFHIRSMQMASDGKIYLADFNSNLAMIQNPNLTCTTCSLDLIGLPAPNSAGGGLPNFISGDFKQPMLPFTYTVDPLFTCNTASYSLSGPNPAITCTACGTNPVSISWDFGDPGSGGANFSSAVDPQHVFNTPGTYTTNVVINYGCASDTFSQVITIAAIAPTVTILGNNTICFGESTSLIASGADLYQWISNAAAPQIQVSPLTTTTYSVIGTFTNGCSVAKTFTVNVSPCTEIKKHDESPDFILYPSPAHSFIFIESTEPFTWEIIDQVGRKILTSTVSDKYNQIDISSLVPGVYYFKYISSSNFETRRILKLE